MNGIKTAYLKLTEKQHAELTDHKAKLGLSWEQFVLKLSRDARGIKV